MISISPYYPICMHYHIFEYSSLITHIVYDLSALGVVGNIQVMGSLQIDGLFMIDL